MSGELTSVPLDREPATAAQSLPSLRGLFDGEAEMDYAEQAALTGILASLRPRLAIELGTFRGGSLSRIAARSVEVHTFDLACHVNRRLPNVTYHLGDSRYTLPSVLSDLSAAGRTVDFALVDGDHSRAGVERDLTALLSSPALIAAVVVVHDCANEGVRKGARRAIMRARDIAYADLSFIAPPAPTSLLAEAWGGLGLIVVDHEARAWPLGHRILDNVHWRTGRPRSPLWHAARPLRTARRELAYSLRPLYRRLKGSRGVKPVPSAGRRE